MNIEINAEFKALIPPLLPEEYRQLEQNIIADGCREPLVVFNGVLVDGHHRHQICTQHGLPFKTVAIDFADNLAAKLWMLDNQSGRRNLSDGWKYQLKQARRELLSLQGKEKKVVDGKQAREKQLGVVSTIDITPEPHSTRTTIANELGWSTGKVAMADKVWKDASPEIKGQVLSGEVSINEAYNALNSGTRHVSEGNNDWYTPSKYIESARSVMGSIDLDPASSDTAQKIVQATTYHTQDDNGLAHNWTGNVWLNPPYSTPDIDLFIKKLQESDTQQWIVLTNNSSDTNWFHRLLKMCDSVCFTKGRIGFENGDAVMATRQGQTFFYFGENWQEFKNEFAQYGLIMVKA